MTRLHRAVKSLVPAGIAAALLAPLATVRASEATDTLSRCLSDNTTGKDRKDLAKWIFVSIASHPEIRPLAEVNASMTTGAQQTMGALVTRLIADACPNELRAVVKEQGAPGVSLAFEYLGKLAMQELMGNPQVNSSVGGFERYMDKAKVERVLRAN